VDAQFPPYTWEQNGCPKSYFSGNWSSLAGASRQGPVGGSRPGELQGSGALEETNGREPGSVSLEGLAEKVGILGLQRRKKNRCGAAKRRLGRARLAVASGQTRGLRAANRYGKKFQLRLGQGNPWQRPDPTWMHLVPRL
jgi:hypothetical protein